MPSPRAPPYDPFARGPHAVAARTFDVTDAARGRTFPCEMWWPVDAPGPRPLVAYSHPSANHRRAATFLCMHLASHGYVVAALDHSERVVPALARREGEGAGERKARIEAVIAGRVPDLELLLDTVLARDDLGVRLDATRIGVAGHSFGGWTALAAADADRRIASVVAMAPGGASNPKPGILPLALAFERRDVPILYLAAEDDLSTPLDGMFEIYERTPGPKRLAILRRADHYHFMDDVEAIHEAVRGGEWSGELAWLAQTRPFAELSTAEQAHSFARGLAVAHFDATLRADARAARFLAGDLTAELARRGVEAFVPFQAKAGASCT